MAEIDAAITELLERFPSRSCCETPQECRNRESAGRITIDELDPGDCPRCAIKLAHRLGLAHESHRRDAEANMMNEWGANKREKPTRVEAALAREMPDDVLGGGLDEAMAWLLEPGRVYGWLCNLQIDGFYELREHDDQIEVIEREFVPATEDRTGHRASTRAPWTAKTSRPRDETNVSGGSGKENRVDTDGEQVPAPGSNFPPPRASCGCQTPNAGKLRTGACACQV